jgi:hypothetical protein
MFSCSNPVNNNTKMAEWYDDNEENNFNANEMGANEMGANEMNNAVQHKYRCDCGCNLEFVEYELGFDISIGNNWLITADAMVDYKWSDYIWLHEFNLWQELREDIILNYNQVLNNEPIKAGDGPWVHLYNRLVVDAHHMPLNGELYYEYAY